MGLRVDQGNVLEWPGNADGPAEVGGQKLTPDQTALFAFSSSHTQNLCANSELAKS